MRFGLSSTSGTIFMDAFSIGLPLLICFVTVFSLRRIPRSQRIAATAIGVGVTLLVAALGVFFLVGELRTGVVVGERMVVETPPFASVSVERTDILRARVVADWTQEPDLAVAVRTNGTGMGSYLTGRFRLEDGRSAVLMLSGPACVVIELKDVVLMLAPDDLDGFVRALQAWGVPVT
ncbi:MAG: PH domain-containing protein [Caldiserica bacterium]|nr:PH domain-containing protein [Caldisericota bacterium]